MMPLVIVKEKSAASLQYLFRLVLKRIYDRQSMSDKERKLMEESFVNWHKCLRKTEEQEEVLKRLAWMIDRDDKGGFEKRKELFKKHKIDYRKFHRLPEAYLVKV